MCGTWLLYWTKHLKSYECQLHTWVPVSIISPSNLSFWIPIYLCTGSTFFLSVLSGFSMHCPITESLSPSTALFSFFLLGIASRHPGCPIICIQSHRAQVTKQTCIGQSASEVSGVMFLSLCLTPLLALLWLLLRQLFISSHEHVRF